MRDDWRRVPLRDVAVLDIDRVPVLPGRKFAMAGVLNAGNGLFERGTIDSSETNYPALHRLRAGQLVMRKLTAWEGPITCVPREFDGRFVSAEFPTFTLGPRLLPSYMSLVCQQPTFWEEMKDRSTGTVQRRKRVNPQELLAIAIDLPPLADQRRAVDLIRAVDHLIANTNRLLTAAERTRMAVLGDVLGAIGDESAARAALGDIATIRIGRTPPRSEARYWTSELGRPFCSIADMSDWTVLPVREGVTEAAEVEGKAKRVPAGSLLLSFKLTIGRVGVAAIDLFPNEAIAWVEPISPAVDKRYLGIWLGHSDLTPTSGRAVKGDTLNSHSLRAIEVLLPPLDTQLRVVRLVEAANAGISTARGQLRAAREFRSNLLGSLLAGDRAIPESYDRFLDDAA